MIKKKNSLQYQDRKPFTFKLQMAAHALTFQIRWLYKTNEDYISVHFFTVMSLIVAI